MPQATATTIMSTGWRRWRICCRPKGVAGKGDIDALAAAWERAAHATPHGKPILLENDPGPTG